jgi:hypothetical protein
MAAMLPKVLESLADEAEHSSHADPVTAAAASSTNAES